MALRPALLCIHRDPHRIRVLENNGYKVLTATNAQEGLQLLASELVDAIVLEYNLGRVDASVFASEMKQLRPNIPIVMLAERAELPEAALESVDALVSISDPPYFLWAAVHFALSVSRAPEYRQEPIRNPREPGNSRPLGRRKRNAPSTKGAGSAIGEMVQF
jgi:CheY-like chemotaxis protein